MPAPMGAERLAGVKSGPHNTVAVSPAVARTKAIGAPFKPWPRVMGPEIGYPIGFDSERSAEEGSRIAAPPRRTAGVPPARHHFATSVVRDVSASTTPASVTVASMETPPSLTSSFDCADVV